MNIRTFTARTAVAGATTALAAAGLVGISSTAANAATVTNTYTCTIAALSYSFDIPMTVTGSLPVEQYGAGASVPKELMNVDAAAVVPPDSAAMLQDFGVDKASAKDYAIALGSGAVGVPLAGPITEEEGVYTWDAAGKNKSFVTPAPGVLEALLPASFTFSVVTNAFGPIDIPCIMKEGETAGSLGAITLVKQSSTTDVKAKTITVKKNKAVKIPVSFSGDAGGVGMGKVQAKEGKKVLKTVSVKNGKATLNLGKLKVGRHSITVSYLGNSSIGGSSDKVTVKVTK